MVIETYQNSAEVNRVDKTNFITSVGSYTGTLRRECSIISPSIDIESAAPPNFNYAYMPDFSRYYFVTAVTSINNKLWRVDFNIDVLMTYRTEIGRLSAIIARQENKNNPYLIDNQIPTQNNTAVEFVEFESSPFSTQLGGSVYNFVLNVMGAGG